jgi:hypothetical protein
MRPAAEEGQPLHDQILALFYRCVFDIGEAATCKTLFSGEAERDRTAYINGMLATSPHVAFDTRSQARYED